MRNIIRNSGQTSTITGLASRSFILIHLLQNNPTMKELVLNSNGQPVTNSVLVAEKFGKQHKNVIASIRAIIEQAENLARQMFVESQYVDNKGESRPMFIMNRDGFTLLAMGFTGKEALQFKLEFINAFNKMEKQLKEQHNLSPAEMLLKQCQIMVEHEKRLSTVEQKVNEVLAIREEAQKDMLSLPLSTDAVPELSMRDKVRALVNKYSMHFNVPQKNVWDHIYQTLYYNYHIALRSYARKKNESLIDVAERVGALDKMYAIISNLSRQNGLVA